MPAGNPQVAFIHDYRRNNAKIQLNSSNESKSCETLISRSCVSRSLQEAPGEAKAIVAAMPFRRPHQGKDRADQRPEVKLWSGAVHVTYKRALLFMGMVCYRYKGKARTKFPSVLFYPTTAQKPW